MERVWAVLVWIAQAAGITLAVAMGGLAGALISTFSMDGTATGRQRVYSALAGLGISWFGAPALISYFELHDATSGFTALLLGIFGMAVLNEIQALIKGGLIRDVINTVLNARKGKTGREK